MAVRPDQIDNLVDGFQRQKKGRRGEMLWISKCKISFYGFSTNEIEGVGILHSYSICRIFLGGMILHSFLISKFQMAMWGAKFTVIDKLIFLL